MPHRDDEVALAASRGNSFHEMSLSEKGLSRCLEVFPIAIVFLAFEKETTFHFSKKDILQSARNVFPRVLSASDEFFSFALCKIV